MQAETDKSIKKINSNGCSYSSGLSTFRILCGDAFPEIAEYLEKNHKHPVSVRSTGQDAVDPTKKVEAPK